MAIYATIDARIEHIDGPGITDTAHVLNWLLGDGAQYVIP